MVTEKINPDYSTLLQAIKAIEAEGYTTQFFMKSDRLVDPKTKKAYAAKDVKSVDFIRIEAPLSDPDEESILYLIVTKTKNKGWISDSFGIYSDSNLKNLLSLVEQLNIPE